MNRFEKIVKGIAVKKKAFACILVLAMVLPRTSLAVTNAQEAIGNFSVSGSQVSGGNGAGQVSGGNPGQDTETDNPGQTPGENGAQQGGDSSGQVSGGDAQSPEGDKDDISGGDAEQPPEVDDKQDADDAPEEEDDMQLPDGEGAGQVSGGDAEQLPEKEETPSVDTSVGRVYVQQVEITYENMNAIGGLQMGSASSQIVIRPVPLSEAEMQYVKPLVGLYYGYDGQEHYADCTEEGIAVNIPYEYYGSFYCYGVDAEGNVSDRISTQVMIDCTAPSISWEEVQINETRYIRITLQESGEILSGIDLTRCFIHGVSAESIHFNEEEIIENIFGQAVLGSTSIDVSIDKLDEVNIELSIADYVGNISSEVLMWSVETVGDESQILSVAVPCNIDFSVAPYRTDKQIESELLTIINNSECDIYFTLNNVTITLNRDNVKEKPEIKNCSMYLEAVGGERYFLPEGESGELCTVRIPGKDSESGSNTFCFFVDGFVNPESADTWRDGDITISILVSFRGIEPEEEDDDKTVVGNHITDAAILKDETDE